ncbi:MAG: DDE-type integrase/transposase/recombinase [Paracoccaceae bacterium]|nr:DDE-type integrase/transposase/recombinase [Paracoccaceae bacterium]
MTTRRIKRAALKLLRKLMKRYGHAEEFATESSASCETAHRKFGATEKQRTGRWLNNRIENSHLPLLRRERAMQRFRGIRSLQKSAAVHCSV